MLLTIAGLAGCDLEKAEPPKGPDKSFCFEESGCGFSGMKIRKPPPSVEEAIAEERKSLPRLIPLEPEEAVKAEWRYVALREGTCGPANCFHGIRIRREAIIGDRQVKAALYQYLNDPATYAGIETTCASSGYGFRIKSEKVREELWIDGDCHFVKSWSESGGHREYALDEAPEGRLASLLRRVATS